MSLHLQTGAVKQSVQYCEICAIIETYGKYGKYVKCVKYTGSILQNVS